MCFHAAFISHLQNGKRKAFNSGGADVQRVGISSKLESADMEGSELVS